MKIIPIFLHSIWILILIHLQTLNLHLLYIPKLINLDPAKASGSEGWSILSFKDYAQQLSIPFSILFSKSFNSTSLPLAWKEALVTLIYKKGDCTAVSNYWPISLIYPIVKIMESFVRDQIQEHMTTINLFGPNQYGFSLYHSVIHCS